MGMGTAVSVGGGANVGVDVCSGTAVAVGNGVGVTAVGKLHPNKTPKTMINTSQFFIGIPTSRHPGQIAGKRGSWSAQGVGVGMMKGKRSKLGCSVTKIIGGTTITLPSFRQGVGSGAPLRWPHQALPLFQLPLN